MRDRRVWPLRKTNSNSTLTRMNALDRLTTAESLVRWFDATWDTRQSERRRAAAATITGAVDHWRARDGSPKTLPQRSAEPTTEIQTLNGAPVPTEEQSTRKHAAKGALLGAACGDSLGAPFEGSRAVSRMLVENWRTSSWTMRYTDDTAMTLVVARHLLSTGGTIDEERLAKDFADEWQAVPDRGYGAAPPKIFRAVLSGEDWATVARAAFGGTGSWGNGGAMRVAPVALLPGSVSDRVLLARRQAAITHAHPLAQDGATVQCAAIAQAAMTVGENIDADDFCAALGQHVTTAEFHNALADIRDLTRAGAPPREIAARLGADVTALGSVPTAIALFLRSPDDMETALVSAVHAGGDTDTIASMVGAITGARLGQAGLPSRLISRLENAQEILGLAEDLASLAPS